jgi:hypothetical protein
VGIKARSFAVALLFVLLQAAWTSAQESTSSASGLFPIGRPRFDWRHERDDAQKAATGVVPQEGSRTTDSDPIRAHDTNERWGHVIRQTLTLQAIQHSFYMTEPKARHGLDGPFFHDWFESASSPFVEPHWSDGGRFLVNYIGHPIDGSTYAYIYRQNNPSAMRIEFGQRGYAAHLAKASGIAALSSLQWELGPFSEASIENVGLPPNRYKMAWIDMVVTPTLGVSWMAGEDALDRFVIQRLEQKIDSAAGKAAIRILLNPSRSMANVMAGQKPWKRPGRS